MDAWSLVGLIEIKWSLLGHLVAVFSFGLLFGRYLEIGQ